ncbi:MAG: hypothetical protein K2P49_11975, partial [Oscillospiraceae bacterium]|nr:hypothetical protein [Oscillospiraceae bacterium]
HCYADRRKMTFYFGENRHFLLGVDRRRAESVRNVKNTNGRMPFEQKVRAANEAEDEWLD